MVYPSGGVDTRLFAPRDRNAILREKFSFEKSNYVIGFSEESKRTKVGMCFFRQLLN